MVVSESAIHGIPLANALKPAFDFCGFVLVGGEDNISAGGYIRYFLKVGD